MKLCDNPDCVQVAIVDVQDREDPSAQMVSLCEECLAERYDVRLCSYDDCKRAAVLAVTVQPFDQDEEVTLYFCETCKQKPVELLYRPSDFDEGVKKLLADGSPETASE